MASLADIKDAIYDAYLQLEDRYYDALDWLSAHHIPLDRVAEAIESKGIPSFPIAILVLLAIITGAIWAIMGGTTQGYTITVFSPDGTPLANTTVLVNGRPMVTDEYGQIHLKGVDGPVSIEATGYKPYVFDPTETKTVLLEPQVKEITIYVKDKDSGRLVNPVIIKVEGDGTSEKYYSNPAKVRVGRVRTENVVVPLNGKITVTVTASGYKEKVEDVDVSKPTVTIFVEQSITSSTGLGKGTLKIYITPKNAKGLAKIYKNNIQILTKPFSGGYLEIHGLTYGTYKVVFEPYVNGDPVINQSNKIYVRIASPETIAKIDLLIPGYDGNIEEYNESVVEKARHLVKIVVKSEDGNPIRGAELINAITGAEIGQKSNKKGVITISIDNNTEINAYVNHPKYYPSKTFVINKTVDNVNVTLKKLPEKGNLRICVKEPGIGGGYVPVPNAYYRVEVNSWNITGNVGQDGCTYVKNVLAGNATIIAMYPTGDFPTTKEVVVKSDSETNVTIYLSRKIPITLDVYLQKKDGTLVTFPQYFIARALDRAEKKWDQADSITGKVTLRIPAYTDVKFVILYNGGKSAFETGYREFYNAKEINVVIPEAPKTSFEITRILNENGDPVLMLQKGKKYIAEISATCAGGKCAAPVNARGAELAGSKIVVINCGKNAACSGTFTRTFTVTGDKNVELSVGNSRVILPVGFEMTGCDDCYETHRLIVIDKKTGRKVPETALTPGRIYEIYIPFAVKMDGSEEVPVSVDVASEKKDGEEIFIPLSWNARVLSRIGKFNVGIAKIYGIPRAGGAIYVTVNVANIYQIDETLQSLDPGVKKEPLKARILADYIPANCRGLTVPYIIDSDTNGLPAIVYVNGKQVGVITENAGEVNLDTTGGDVTIEIDVPGFEKWVATVHPLPIDVNGSGTVVIFEGKTSAIGTVTYSAKDSGEENISIVKVEAISKNTDRYEIFLLPAEGNTCDVNVTKKDNIWLNEINKYDIYTNAEVNYDGAICSATAKATIYVIEHNSSIERRPKKGVANVELKVNDDCSCDGEKFRHSITIKPEEGNITLAKLAGKECDVRDGVANCSITSDYRILDIEANIYVDGLKWNNDKISLDCGGNSPPACPIPTKDSVSVSGACTCDDEYCTISGNIEAKAVGGWIPIYAKVSYQNDNYDANKVKGIENTWEFNIPFTSGEQSNIEIEVKVTYENAGSTYIVTKNKTIAIGTCAKNPENKEAQNVCNEIDTDYDVINRKTIISVPDKYKITKIKDGGGVKCDINKDTYTTAECDCTEAQQAQVLVDINEGREITSCTVNVCGYIKKTSDVGVNPNPPGERSTICGGCNKIHAAIIGYRYDRVGKELHVLVRVTPEKRSCYVKECVAKVKSEVFNGVPESVGRGCRINITLPENKMEKYSKEFKIPVEINAILEKLGRTGSESKKDCKAGAKINNMVVAYVKIGKISTLSEKDKEQPNKMDPVSIPITQNANMLFGSISRHTCVVIRTENAEKGVCDPNNEKIETKIGVFEINETKMSDALNVTVYGNINKDVIEENGQLVNERGVLNKDIKWKDGEKTTVKTMWYAPIEFILNVPITVDVNHYFLMREKSTDTIIAEAEKQFTFKPRLFRFYVWIDSVEVNRNGNVTLKAHYSGCKGCGVKYIYVVLNGKTPGTVEQSISTVQYSINNPYSAGICEANVYAEVKIFDKKWKVPIAHITINGGKCSKTDGNIKTAKAISNTEGRQESPKESKRTNATKEIGTAFIDVKYYTIKNTKLPGVNDENSVYFVDCDTKEIAVRDDANIELVSDYNQIVDYATFLYLLGKYGSSEEKEYSGHAYVVYAPNVGLATTTKINCGNAVFTQQLKTVSKMMCDEKGGTITVGEYTICVDSKPFCEYIKKLANLSWPFDNPPESNLFMTYVEFKVKPASTADCDASVTDIRFVGIPEYVLQPPWTAEDGKIKLTILGPLSNGTSYGFQCNLAAAAKCSWIDRSCNDDSNWFDIGYKYGIEAYSTYSDVRATSLKMHGIDTKEGEEITCSNSPPSFTGPVPFAAVYVEGKAGNYFGIIHLTQEIKNYLQSKRLLTEITPNIKNEEETANTSSENPTYVQFKNYLVEMEQGKKYRLGILELNINENLCGGHEEGEPECARVSPFDKEYAVDWDRGTVTPDTDHAICEVDIPGDEHPGGAHVSLTCGDKGTWLVTYGAGYRYLSSCDSGYCQDIEPLPEIHRIEWDDIYASVKNTIKDMQVDLNGTTFCLYTDKKGNYNVAKEGDTFTVWRKTYECNNWEWVPTTQGHYTYVNKLEGCEVSNTGEEQVLTCKEIVDTTTDGTKQGCPAKTYGGVVYYEVDTIATVGSNAQRYKCVKIGANRFKWVEIRSDGASNEIDESSREKQEQEEYLLPNYLEIHVLSGRVEAKELDIKLNENKVTCWPEQEQGEKYTCAVENVKVETDKRDLEDGGCMLVEKIGDGTMAQIVEKGSISGWMNEKYQCKDNKWVEYTPEIGGEQPEAPQTITLPNYLIVKGSEYGITKLQVSNKEITCTKDGDKGTYTCDVDCDGMQQSVTISEGDCVARTMTYYDGKNNVNCALVDYKAGDVITTGWSEEQSPEKYAVCVDGGWVVIDNT